MGWFCGKFFISHRDAETQSKNKKYFSATLCLCGKNPVNIILVEPEIPPNTGNVARLCAATKSVLHLIEPFGFKLDDSQLKRAGMDYWQHVEWHRWRNWTAFAEKLPANARLWFVESNGEKTYSDAKFSTDDYLVFGRETAGLPKQLLEQNR